MNKDAIQNLIKTTDELKALANQKLRAKEKFESNITLGYDGGLFKIDIQLLNYVAYLLTNGKRENTVIVDSNENPILVKDVKDFQDNIQDRYYTALDIYHNDHKDLERLKISTARYVDLET